MKSCCANQLLKIYAYKSKSKGMRTSTPGHGARPLSEADTFTHQGSCRVHTVPEAVCRSSRLLRKVSWKEQRAGRAMDVPSASFRSASPRNQCSEYTPNRPANEWHRKTQHTECEVGTLNIERLPRLVQFEMHDTSAKCTAMCASQHHSISTK